MEVIDEGTLETVETTAISASDDTDESPPDANARASRDG
jgi:hypothetical protein